MTDLSLFAGIDMDVSWQRELADEFRKPYFVDLQSFVAAEREKYVVLPPATLVFEAFKLTPLPTVKVVILGQDPYHGRGQAHGLCFSVCHGVKVPPSLRNIYKELHSDLGGGTPVDGNLENWARQGVFLLNATLTVRENETGSHQHKGWETFTDTVIHILNAKKSHLVFLLWGRYAQQKLPLIDTNRHLVLIAAHPSPLSARHGFFGCKHFSQTNNYLTLNGLTPISW